MRCSAGRRWTKAGCDAMLRTHLAQVCSSLGLLGFHVECSRRPLLGRRVWIVGRRSRGVTYDFDCCFVRILQAPSSALSYETCFAFIFFILLVL